MRYDSDRRAYHAKRTQVSADRVSWTTVYTSTVSGEYLESAAGKTFTFSKRAVRYVRDYLNGSNVNANNHGSEIEVWGEAPSDLISAYVGNYYEWSPRASVKYYYAGGRRVAVRAGSQAVKYLLGDHLGSTSVTVDANGNRVAELRYEPWGETRYSSGVTPTTFHFTGQREEKGLGLYFYGARWYDPYITRFVQPDSIIPEATQGTQSWDRYAYTNNNPVRYNDPSGHCLVLCTAVIGAVVGAVIVGTTYALTNQGENFNWGEFAVAAGGGAVAGALVGSGIGLVAGAVSTATAAGASMAATAEAVAAVSATSTSLISAGTSAGVSGLSYMAQTPGNFEVAPYVIGSAASGVVGYYSPGASVGGKVALNVAGTELTYAATSKNPTLEGAVASGLGGAVSGLADWGTSALVAPSLDTFVRMYPGPVASATGTTVDGIFSNVWGNVASVYAQKKALEAK